MNVLFSAGAEALKLICRKHVEQLNESRQPEIQWIKL